MKPNIEYHLILSDNLTTARVDTSENNPKKGPPVRIHLNISPLCLGMGRWQAVIELVHFGKGGGGQEIETCCVLLGRVWRRIRERESPAASGPPFPYTRSRPNLKELLKNVAQLRRTYQPSPIHSSPIA
mmetsp:Transcript_1438/g.2044  ORF Transcript_1438/g.2044 Transcript_1438/m.2044 type:complete len:129 (+) Transcript_1438:102-488(+)